MECVKAGSVTFVEGEEFPTIFQRVLAEHRRSSPNCITTMMLDDRPQLFLFRQDITDQKWADMIRGKRAVLN